MRGLLAKIARETAVITGLFAAALLLMNVSVTYLLPQFQSGMSTVLQDMPFIKGLIEALMGTELGETLTAQMMQAVIWVHPVVLTIVWAYEIVFCTRMPAGEIDRGTIDVLLSWPVSRWRVYLSETIGWLAGGVVVLLFGLLGHWLARGSLPDEMCPAAGPVLLIELNFLCVYVAIGGIAMLTSACCDRRGRAAGIAASFVVLSFLLNFLAQFWVTAKSFSFLNVMSYFQPARILVEERLPVEHVAVLLGIGALGWLAGGVIFTRRSLCTV